MPQKFTFPSIEQALTLQNALNMEEIKTNLRNWFNQNPDLKISQNVAWSFKLSNGDLLRRYIHCKFCQAKLTYVKENTPIDNYSNTFRLVKFHLHHDHRMIQSVKQKGKLKTFPQNYTKIPEHGRHSIERERKLRSEKMRKRRVQINKFKKLELYYRLNFSVRESDRGFVNIKEFAAKSIGLNQERFMSFLNSNTRGVVEVSAIKKLLKRAGFEKYNVQLDNTSDLKYNKSQTIQNSDVLNQVNSQEEEIEIKEKKKSASLIIEESKEYFKELMIFVNYNENSKRNLFKSQGLINVSHLPLKIVSKKFMTNMKWEALLLYSHDQNFIANQLYAIIMIESSKFNIRQIKKCFQIAFKLLNPLKKLKFQCCIHQENIYIMGALDLIIEEAIQQNKQSKVQQQLSNSFLTYFLSPKLSANIINKCEFIPKIFRKKLIDKIYNLDPKEIDVQYQKIVLELEKAAKQLKQYKARTQEYLAQLKEFYQNFHKIFLGKFSSSTFVSLMFAGQKPSYDSVCTSMDDYLQKSLSQYAQGNKYFLEFIILILEVFHVPGGSFIYNKYEGETRQPTKVETIYANYLVMPEQRYFDEIKKIYNTKTFQGKYVKSKLPESKKQNADFFDEFSAILYERVYRLKEVFMKVAPQVLFVLLRQIQKSFTLQIQTRTLQQIKKDGTIKTKQQNKSPNTVRILDFSRFWTTQKQREELNNRKNIEINLIQLEASVIQLENSQLDQGRELQSKGNAFQKQNSAIRIKKLWQCDCNWSKFTLLPCCHEIRCCLTFFTSIEDQINDFWMFDPKTLEQLEDNENKSDILTQDEQNNDRQEQNNSQSD